jgi:hypothetical protein
VIRPKRTILPDFHALAPSWRVFIFKDMTAEQLLRAHAARLEHYRFRGVDHMIDFLRQMQRECLQAANELSKRRDDARIAEPSVANRYLGRPRQGILEINGRMVIVEKRSA